MQIRRFNKEKDYDTIVSWCKKRDFPPIPKDMVDGLGLIIDDFAVCWLNLMVGSPFAFLSFPVTNPDADKIKRKEALKLIFDHCHKIAKNYNYTYMFTTSNTPPVVDLLAEFGYTEGDKNVTQYFVRL